MQVEQRHRTQIEENQTGSAHEAQRGTARRSFFFLPNPSDLTFPLPLVSPTLLRTSNLLLSRYHCSPLQSAPTLSRLYRLSASSPIPLYPKREISLPRRHHHNYHGFRFCRSPPLLVDHEGTSPAMAAVNDVVVADHVHVLFEEIYAALLARLRQEVQAGRQLSEHEIHALHQQLQESIKALRRELRDKIDLMRTELKRKSDALREELKEELAASRNEMNARVGVFQRQINALQREVTVSRGELTLVKETGEQSK